MFMILAGQIPVFWFVKSDFFLVHIPPSAGGRTPPCQLGCGSCLSCLDSPDGRCGRRDPQGLGYLGPLSARCAKISFPTWRGQMCVLFVPEPLIASIPNLPWNAGFLPVTSQSFHGWTPSFDQKSISFHGRFCHIFACWVCKCCSGCLPLAAKCMQDGASVGAAQMPGWEVGRLGNSRSPKIWEGYVWSWGKQRMASGNFTVCYGYGFDEPFTVCYGFHDKSRFQRCVFPCDCNKWPEAMQGNWKFRRDPVTIFLLSIADSDCWNGASPAWISNIWDYRKPPEKVERQVITVLIGSLLFFYLFWGLLQPDWESLLGLLIEAH